MCSVFIEALERYWRLCGWYSTWRTESLCSYLLEKNPNNKFLLEFHPGRTYQFRLTIRKRKLYTRCVSHLISSQSENQIILPRVVICLFRRLKSLHSFSVLHSSYIPFNFKTGCVEWPGTRNPNFQMAVTSGVKGRWEFLSWVVDPQMLMLSFINFFILNISK